MSQNIVPRDGGLFQSDMWKVFQQSLGKKTFETEYFWGVLGSAPLLGNYGEISRGPVCLETNVEGVKNTFQNLAKIHNLSFVRVEPQEESTIQSLQRTSLTVRKAPFDVQPREILLLSLEPSEEQLFQGMKSKTRYNIRLAEKKSITIVPLKSEEHQEEFLDILGATAARKGVVFHSREYYQKFITFFTNEKGATFVALKNGKVLAGATLVFCNKTAYYVHGGSSNEGRNCMAPHLLQWEMIRFAKNAGYMQYDFGGVARNFIPKGKDWSGITRFKEGFAPTLEVTVFPGTYDIIFAPIRYYLYQWLLRCKKVFS